MAVRFPSPGRIRFAIAVLSALGGLHAAAAEPDHVSLSESTIGLEHGQICDRCGERVRRRVARQDDDRRSQLSRPTCSRTAI